MAENPHVNNMKTAVRAETFRTNYDDEHWHDQQKVSVDLAKKLRPPYLNSSVILRKMQQGFLLSYFPPRTGPSTCMN